MEFIPASKSVKGFYNLDKTSNRIIVSYWGKGNNGLGRFGEILNALRLGIQNNKSQSDLMDYVIKELEDTTAIGVRASMDETSKKILERFYNIAAVNNRSEFLRLSILELFENYKSRIFVNSGEII